MRIDHVGLLLRYSSGHLILFEATGDNGVILTEWNDFYDYKWYLLYDKIVYRKLHCERSNEMVTRLETFIKSSLGKPYKINASKICCNRVSKKVHDEGKVNQNSYFCSELVAAAL